MVDQIILYSEEMVGASHPTKSDTLNRALLVEHAADGTHTYHVKGDGTAGRVLRFSYLTIEDGTDADKIKCTLVSQWNGDAIGATDNIAKNATTGNFTLNATGYILTIEAAGLSGNVVAAFAVVARNESTTPCTVVGTMSANDIYLAFYKSADGTLLDLTTVGGAHTGDILINICYITAA